MGLSQQTTSCNQIDRDTEWSPLSGTQRSGRAVSVSVNQTKVLFLLIIIINNYLPLTDFQAKI